MNLQTNPRPVMPVQCPTCPFREKGWSCVRDLLIRRILTEASPICHSTGCAIAPAKRLHRKAHLCRGARDYALQFFAGIGFLEAPTDAAWDKKAAELLRKRRPNSYRAASKRLETRI